MLQSCWNFKMEFTSNCDLKFHETCYKSLINMGSSENAMLIPEKKKAEVALPVSSDTKVIVQKNGVTVDIIPVQNKLARISHESKMLEKLMYMVSIVSIVMLSFSLVAYQWILPYYYTAFFPVLFLIRIVQYWRYKWQFYLIDFCYFANITTIIFIWACPDNALVFTVLFGLANGPLTWAVVIFRNSVVFHSTDKMTSTFIHLLPCYLLFCVRWYPNLTSEFWYVPFLNTFNKDAGFMFLWLAGIPFAVFFFHSLLYMSLVYGVCRPSEEYDTSFRYVSTKTSFKTLTGALGPKHHFLMYNILLYIYCILSLCFTPIWYFSFPAHCAYVAAATFAAFWNGAGFYLQTVNRKKSVQSEDSMN